MLTDENFRFFQLVEELKTNGKVADYVQLAATLGTNKAGISDIKSGRKKISIELLRRMKSSYPNINLNWIIMGIGEMYCLDTVPDTEPIVIPNNNMLVEFFKQFNPVLEQKDNKLLQQAEELGQLKERIRLLEQRLEKTACSANIADTANVG